MTNLSIYSFLTLTTASASLALAAPVAAQDRSGRLDTLPVGTYECALPGNAAGAAYVVQKDREFRIASASRYETAKGNGTYLLTGDTIVVTRGPMQGERYQRTGKAALRELGGDGEPTRLRCIMVTTAR